MLRYDAGYVAGGAANLLANEENNGRVYGRCEKRRKWKKSEINGLYCIFSFVGYNIKEWECTLYSVAHRKEILMDTLNPTLEFDLIRRYDRPSFEYDNILFLLDSGANRPVWCSGEELL